MAKIETKKECVMVGVLNPNEELLDALSKIDYADMTGQNYRDYCMLLQSLPERNNYNFAVMKVEPLKKVRYVGVKESPVDIVGVRIKDVKPVIAKTRVTPKQAMQANGKLVKIPDSDVYELIGGQFFNEGNNQFYFLKKNL